MLALFVGIVQIDEGEVVSFSVIETLMALESLLFELHSRDQETAWS